MSDSDPDSAAKRGFPTLNRIDLLCDQFESAWLAGERPDIVAAVESAKPSDRSRLVLELLELEIDYRQQAGETPVAADYLDRLPSFWQQIGKLLPLSAETQYSESLATAAQDQPLQTIGEYELLEFIGKGGMGTVCKARHRKLKRIVALKLLPSDTQDLPAAIARFEREMQLIGQLDHANIVRAFDAGTIDGTPYLAMEYVQGVDLSRRIKAEGPLPVEQALDYVRQAAVGLAYAHSQQIVHRDVKPANMLLDESGVVKLLDLGLARLESEYIQQSTAMMLTQAGQVLGTFDYLSPEQAIASRDVDHRTDIYSLGCSLYVLLTGKHMFSGSSSVEKVMAHRSEPAPSILETRPEVPIMVERVYLKMVEKKPADRYTDMTAVIAALDQCLAGSPVPANLADTCDLTPQPITQQPALPGSASAVPSAPEPHLPTGGKGKRIRFTLLAILLLGMLVGGGVFYRATHGGEVRVDSPDGELQLELLREGEVIRTIAARQLAESTWLECGSYELRILGAGDYYRLQGEQFTISRGCQRLVSVVPIGFQEIVTSPQYIWTEPVNLGVPNGSTHDSGPALTTDGLLLLFSSDRKGSYGKSDLWQCTRSAIDDPWSAPRNLGAIINSRESELYPELSADGLTLVFSSDRPGGVGDYDLWISHRASRKALWSRPVNLDLGVNSVAAELGAALSPDQRSLVFASRRTGGQGALDLWQVTRESLQSRFGSPTNLGSQINSPGDDQHPAFADQGAMLLFASLRTGGHGRSDIYLTTRSSPDQAWSAPLGIGNHVNKPGNEQTPELFAADRLLYYTSYDLNGGRGGSDIYVSQRALKSSLAAAAPVERAEQPTTDPAPAVSTPEPPPSDPGPPLAIAPLTSSQAKAHQRAWAEHLGVPVEREITIHEGVKMTFVLIPPGEFQMGITHDDAYRIAAAAREHEADFDATQLNSEMPQHLVTITKPFYFGKHEMTVGQWHRIMEPDTSSPAEANRAASHITWEESQALLLKLNEAQSDSNILFQLPTEAQWELACRAGTTTDYYFGNNPDQLAEYAWFDQTTADKPKEVGQRKPNAWGLYDMLGNASEWCSDGFDRNHYAVSGRYDPQGFKSSAYLRTHRGGSWLDQVFDCRSTSREVYFPTEDYPQIGVRLVVTPPAAEDL